jgi:predicted transcriptional regulator
MKKRSRLDVIYDMLSIVKNKNNTIKPTPLMRFSNLSSQGFNQYITELKEKDFIREEKDKNNRTYITLTDKGFKFLEKYTQIKGFVDEFGL